MEFTLLWAALTGAGLAWLGTRVWSQGLPDRPADRMIGAAAGGLLAGRLTAMVLQGINPLANPFDILIVRGGVHTGAAAAGAILAYLWAVRWRTEYLDATAPAALLGLAGWHAGCLWRGACLGTASDLPWAWAQQGSAVSRHPVELYAAVALAAGAWIVSKMPSRILVRAGGALAMAGLVRLATETMRLSLSGGPVAWYAAAIVVGVLLTASGPLLAGRRAPSPT